MLTTTEFQYIVIEDTSDAFPHRKTKTFTVWTKSKPALLGWIQWRGAWRQYVYEPVGETVYSVGCLADIQSFINDIS